MRPMHQSPGRRDFPLGGRAAIEQEISALVADIDQLADDLLRAFLIGILFLNAQVWFMVMHVSQSRPTGPPVEGMNCSGVSKSPENPPPSRSFMRMSGWNGVVSLMLNLLAPEGNMAKPSRRRR